VLTRKCLTVRTKHQSSYHTAAHYGVILYAAEASTCTAFCGQFSTLIAHIMPCDQVAAECSHNGAPCSRLHQRSTRSLSFSDTHTLPDPWRV